MLIDYLFEDCETGEQFLVEAEGYEDAEIIALEYFNEVKFIESMSVAEGEWLGLDTY